MTLSHQLCQLSAVPTRHRLFHPSRRIVRVQTYDSPPSSRPKSPLSARVHSRSLVELNTRILTTDSPEDILDLVCLQVNARLTHDRGSVCLLSAAVTQRRNSPPSPSAPAAPLHFAPILHMFSSFYLNSTHVSISSPITAVRRALLNFPDPPGRRSSHLTTFSTLLDPP